MTHPYPLKETPLAKEGLIWFIIATTLAIVNWLASVGAYSELPGGTGKLFLLHVIYSYFVFLHILAMVALFRITIWKHIRTLRNLFQEAVGMLFAFIGFSGAMVNLQWFGEWAHGLFFPAIEFAFSFSDSIIQLFVLFAVIAATGVFSISYYTMRLNLKDSYRIHVESERLRNELETAREMQMGIMPSEAPAMSGFDIAGFCIPATEVGGDYFDYIWLDDTRSKLGLAIADVSGKGMKAAMTAVMLSGMLHAQSARDKKTEDILGSVNSPMCRKTDPGMFIAMLFGILDSRSGTFTYTNAGQMPPLLYSNGEVCELSVQDVRLPVGVKAGVNYNSDSVALKSGDVLFLYTDGVNEAMNEQRELFGLERLNQSLAEAVRKESSSEGLAHLQSKIDEFTCAQERHDDITMVMIRRSKDGNGEYRKPEPQKNNK